MRRLNFDLFLVLIWLFIPKLSTFCLSHSSAKKKLVEGRGGGIPHNHRYPVPHFITASYATVVACLPPFDLESNKTKTRLEYKCIDLYDMCLHEDALVYLAQSFMRPTWRAQDFKIARTGYEACTNTQFNSQYFYFNLFWWKKGQGLIQEFIMAGGGGA